MRRFLVVGCGGSGGAALAYLMDQLRSDLSAADLAHVPQGWQFVHIDVPTREDVGPRGVGNVAEQGGRYVSTAPGVGSYTVMDAAVSASLANAGALASIATWAPRRPPTVPVPMTEGAGQYRALGRMATLNRAGDVRAALTAAWQRLFTAATVSEMSSLTIPGLGGFSAAQVPVVIVVGSMAGGAGASMALDVCRLLTLIPGVDPNLIGVFMASADVFDSLPATARSGVRANALAMLGEIVANQSGAAQAHDATTLAALGQGGGEGVRRPFARVFPVGRFIGAEKAMFGDGRQATVYRGLGRGLAGLMMSGTATDSFVAHDLTNHPTPVNLDHLGWGMSIPADVFWGSFGFASLSMGRERYAEYAAQRLARSSVDHLLDAHLQPSSSAGSEEQVRALLTSQWESTCTRLGLPSTTGTERAAGAPVGPWLTDVAFPRAMADDGARPVVERELAPYLPAPDGIPAAQWVPALRAQAALRRAALLSGANAAAYLWAYGWHQQLLDRTRVVVADACTRLGLPYAVALVERLRAHARDVLVPGLRDLAAYAPTDLGNPPDLDQLLGGLKGVIGAGGQLLPRVVAAYQGTVRTQIWAHAADLGAKVVTSYDTDVLATLEAALREGQHELERALSETLSDSGLAALSTDQYAAWPADVDTEVSARFTEADNEVMLMSAADFAPRYPAHLQAAVGTAGGSGFEASRTAAVTMVVSGIWPTAESEAAPGGLLEDVAPWRPSVFVSAPGTTQALTPSTARFVVHVRPPELLARSRAFVGRRRESFDAFCSVSLRDYVVGTREGGLHDAPSEIADRQREVQRRFREALSVARPLISADETVIRTIHAAGMVYQYKFSEIPLAGLPVVDAVRTAMEADPRVDPQTASLFTAALSATSGIKRIDIFGSYPQYSPLVFDAVLSPVIDQWNATPDYGREDFWRWRRSRPLPASLPLAEEERRAMVAGWFLGQIVGRIKIPAPGQHTAVQVWDSEEGRWSSFPHPMLTPPSRFIVEYDWLPAVLESVLLAIARSHEPPVMGSLLPYRRLRGLWDDSSQGPASGIVPRSGTGLVTAWLRDGATPPDGESRVPGAQVAITFAQRQSAALAWLSAIRDLAGVEFLSPGEQGAVGGGVYSQITKRSQASDVPMFHDLAADVHRATGELIGLIESATEEAGPTRQPGLVGGGAF